MNSQPDDQHINIHLLFALSWDELGPVKTEIANAHLARCQKCRRIYVGVCELQQESIRLGIIQTKVDDATRMRLWQSLAPEAAAAEQKQRRQFWFLFSNPWLEWLAFALLAAILVFIYWLVI